METRYVTRLPTAVLATGLMLLAFLALTCGLILDSVARGRREAKRLAYLATPARAVEPLPEADEEEVPHAFQLGHFYSPIVDPREAAAYEQSIWRDDDAFLGVDFNDASHRRILQDVFPRYIGDFDYPSEAADALNGHSYYTNNPAFGWLDARLLFVLLREWRPKRVVEIGSGYSSLLMADVNRRFLDGGVDITCVEPDPPEFLRGGVNGIARLIRQRVQSAPADVFAQMADGDVLFIDSSHVAKTGSDVNFLLFEVLPRLAPGVRIHMHDVFFPREYPKEWVLRDNRSWNEQYIVRALLMYSTSFRILFGSSIAYWNHRELLRTALRQTDGLVFGGGSLWIEKSASP
jgi:predicted O-methyltransferase YrrM